MEVVHRLIFPNTNMWAFPHFGAELASAGLSQVPRAATTCRVIQRPITSLIFR